MDLLNENIKKLYIRYLLPSLGSAIVISVYVLTDAIVIGQGEGVDALAAFNLLTPLLCVLVAVGLLIGVGCSVHLSVQKGQGNEKRANEYFTVSLILTCLLAVVMTVIYVRLKIPLLRFAGASDELLPYALEYMNCYNFFIPMAVFSYYLSITARSDKDPNRSLAAVLGGGVTNIVLDILFVFPLGMGMMGAALASGIGVTLQICISGSHFFSKKNTLHLVKPAGVLKKIRDIIWGGMSGFINELSNGWIVFILNMQIIRFCGNTELALYGVISNCSILFNALFTGIGQSMQPLISYHYGAGKMDRIRSLRRLGYGTDLVMGIVFTLSGLLFPAAICSIFVKMTPQITALAGSVMPVYFLAFFPMGISVLSTYYLQSVLKGSRSFCISFLRNIALSTLLVCLLPQLLGGDYLWAAIPLTEAVTAVVSLVFLVSCSRSKEQKKMGRSEKGHVSDRDAEDGTGFCRK